MSDSINLDIYLNRMNILLNGVIDGAVGLFSQKKLALQAAHNNQ